MNEAEFKQKRDELLSKLPVEFRGPVGSYAYEQGHAYGYGEILNDLEDLADLLEKPLAAFAKRCSSPPPRSPPDDPPPIPRPPLGPPRRPRVGERGGGKAEATDKEARTTADPTARTVDEPDLPRRLEAHVRPAGSFHVLRNTPDDAAYRSAMHLHHHRLMPADVGRA